MTYIIKMYLIINCSVSACPGEAVCYITRCVTEPSEIQLVQELGHAGRLLVFSDLTDWKISQQAWIATVICRLVISASSNYASLCTAKALQCDGLQRYNSIKSNRI